MKKHSSFFSSILIFLISLQAGYGQPLPPELPWNGSSTKYIRTKNDPWVTPAELSDLTETPDYATTISWLRKLVEHSRYLTMHSIGKTDENRDLWLVVCSSNGTEKPEQLDRKKPTLLFHAGIHSGEIDGKDAGMMFLRDIVLNQSDLLKKLNILFIPVLSPDGHENRSPFNRVNQRGPKEMGWRTNARNLNLNRDFAKLETPEVRALVKILNTWPVDLYVDIHVTNGIDYQHDITFGYNDKNAYSPNIVAWLEQKLKPDVYRALKKAGHVPGPLLISIDDRNLHAGIFHWTATPRFSNGYGDLRHLATILVENHSLKNYKQRVLGTYVFLQAVAKKLSEDGKSLRQATSKDRALRPEKIPMGWDWDFKNFKPDTLEILGVDYEMYDSPISGTKEVRWLGKPRNFKLPHHVQKAKYQVDRPKAYWIPVTRSDIIQKLKLHGIQLEVITGPKKVSVQLYRLVSPTLAETPFEGRVQLKIDAAKTETHERVYPAGSVRVSTDQPLGDLAIVLLEPFGEDSFLQWGYFHEILQRTEYIDGYVAEPLAQLMLKEKPELQQAFDEALQDEEFADDPDARLRWFYERSPYYDPNYLLYPIGREM